jgi:plastocyanin
MKLTLKKIRPYYQAAFLSLLGLGLLVLAPKSQGYSKPTLSNDEKMILSLAKSDPNAKRGNYDLISRVAKVTSTLDLNSCISYPVVAQVKIGQTLTIRNHDGLSHTIETDHAHEYTIEAGSSKNILVDFGHGAGVYGIACDGSPNIAGLFRVTE